MARYGYIEEYYNYLEKLKQHTSNEQGLSPAFFQLLQRYSMDRDLIVVAEKTLNTGLRPDGTVQNSFYLDIGYWEAKDPKDNLEEEIEKKLSLGYPKQNIIFENSENIVLIQNGKTVFDISIHHKERLHELLETFLKYVPNEIQKFNLALEKFSQDIPNIAMRLRERIEIENSQQFLKVFNDFYRLCRESISKLVTEEDIREMLIQHILTKEIFRVIFGDESFHAQNEISKTMDKLEFLLLGENSKKYLEEIDYYYSTIRDVLKDVSQLRERQQFLIKLYENFYRAYNPKGADRLGIIYTPLEIVDFMITSVDKLLMRHFQTKLSAENVNILDPATGTGSFITEIINYLPQIDLERKFQNELFANEMAILPYYIANLNIEYNYYVKTRKRLKFRNIIFGDTLKMYQAGIKTKYDRQMSLFDENDFRDNLERMERESETDFMVIIGNPPYNANQQNENDNNKNEEYPIIDRRIKDTYISLSSAQKTKVYDMYSRFYRWATDRIRNRGIVAFVSNSSFIDSKSFDGFRKSVAMEFSDIYILDLGGNIRKNEKDGNVFGVKVGIAIFFGVKHSNSKKTTIRYYKIPVKGAINKLEWLKSKNIENIEWEIIEPDKQGNWLNKVDNDWNTLLPMGNKSSKSGVHINAIFQLYSNGVLTARDDWVYDFSQENLEKKIRYFIDEYNRFRRDWANTRHIHDIHEFIYSDENKTIKFTTELEEAVKSNKVLSFHKDNLYLSMYRPFVLKHMYFDKIITHRRYRQHKIFPTPPTDDNFVNVVITVTLDPQSPFIVQSSRFITNYHFGGRSTQTFPLLRYSEDGKMMTENITYYALMKFWQHYPKKVITKKDIFFYIYAVLHKPEYRQKYEINLKQDLPRIPFYKDFDEFVVLGERLLDLHINFLHKPPFPIDFPEEWYIKDDWKQLSKKQILKFFPEKALEYRIGNKSAIEWVIDGYIKYKIRDENVKNHFPKTYLPNYKILEILQKVTFISLETLDIIDKLKKLE